MENNKHLFDVYEGGWVGGEFPSVGESNRLNLNITDYPPTNPRHVQVMN